MRRLLLATITLSFLLVMPRSAEAEVCWQCINSHACDSTGATRGECAAKCSGSQCTCSDEDCHVSQAAPIFQQRGTTYVGPGRAVAVGVQTYVITTCQGDVRGVTYTRQRARKVEAAMMTVALRPVDVDMRATAVVAMGRFRSSAYLRFNLGTE